MVKNNIKVFARLKLEEDIRKVGHYQIIKKKSYDSLILKSKSASELTDNGKKFKFRFVKVFDQYSTQNELFEQVARPVVSSVLQGYNGTIFAYGQTGSGKTYTITGSNKFYNERGVIPRSIEYIFENTRNPKLACVYNVYVSYLEIYNEVGYDLLTSENNIASRIDSLPRVILLEDGKGESHLRNLTIFPVNNMQEAMRLLFLGEANRTMVETSMNVFSSRSHCIFTIYLCTKLEKGDCVRRSKLNVVDLAGSERVHKSNLTSQTLTEAKYINLSLHYLERVITALTQPHRSHIPFRNSMLTYLLKDSLTGNCYTSMLSTLSVAWENRDETISTCKFAQRVSQVDTDPIMNEEINVQQELELAKQENMELKREIYFLKREVVRGVKGSGNDLTKEDKRRLQEMMDKFLQSSEKTDISICKNKEMQFCFSFLKDKLKKVEYSTCVSKAASILVDSKTHKTESKNEEKNSVSNHLDDALSQLSSEIELDTVSLSTSKTLQLTESAPVEVLSSNVDKTRDFFIYSSALQNYCNSARKLSHSIENYKREIIAVKKGLDRIEITKQAKYKLSAELLRLQTHYKNSLIELHDLKRKSDEIKEKLNKHFGVFQNTDWRKESLLNEITIPEKNLSTLKPDPGRNVQCKHGPLVGPFERQERPITPLYIGNPILVCNNDKRSPPSSSYNNYYCKEKKSNYYELQEDLLEKTPTKDTNSDGDTILNNYSNNIIDEIFMKKSYNNNFSENKSASSDSCRESNDQESKESFEHSRSSVQESVCTGSSVSLDSADKDIVSEFVKKLASRRKKKIEEVKEGNLDVSCEMQNSKSPEKRRRLTKEEFIEFMKTIPLTGDPEVDREIEKFYRQRLT